MSVEIILFGVIVIVVIFDRFLNTTLENSFSDEKIMIGKEGSKKIKIKTKALIYIVITISLLIALFIPKSINLSLINNTGLSSIEILFWILLHLLVMYYCYSILRDKFSLKKVIAKEILFLFILITTSIVAYLVTISLNENYEIILKDTSPAKVSLKRINLRSHRQYYKLANSLPHCASFDDINNPIILKVENVKFENYDEVNFIEKYNIINVNTASHCDNFRYTFEYLYKYTFKWGSHPYNVLSNYFWKINLSKSIKDSAIGIIFYVGFIFRGILFLLFGAYQLNKWALVNLKDNE
jgi:hypothetical protein